MYLKRSPLDTSNERVTIWSLCITLIEVLDNHGLLASVSSTEYDDDLLLLQNATHLCRKAKKVDGSETKEEEFRITAKLGR